MKEMDKALWTQLLQDRPISSTTLGHFQMQLMAQIVAHPVDFKEEIRIAERRKWGIGLGISLIVLGLVFATILWFERTIVFQGLNVFLVMLSGLTYVADLQQIGTGIVEDLLLLKRLEIGLSLVWGVISWPVFGVLSFFVIVTSVDQAHEKTHSS